MRLCLRDEQDGCDFGAALAALRYASTSARFDDYWSDHVRMFDRALASATNWSLTERVGTGIGVSAAMFLPFGSIFERCGEAKLPASSWAEVCDQVGQKMFDEGRTYMTQAIGIDLRDTMADISTDPVYRSTVQRLKTEFNTRSMNLLANGEALNLLFKDERVLGIYLNDLDNQGEIEAMDLVIAEVARLKNVPGYDQCNFEGIPF